MSTEFLFRVVGMCVFGILGGRLGGAAASSAGIPIEATVFIFMLGGVLTGLILTPYITVRPVRFVNRTLMDKPVERVLIGVVGMAVGLVLALLVAYPLGLTPGLLGTWLPAIVTVVSGYVFMTFFGTRSREILGAVNMPQARPRRFVNASPERQLLLDTSVLIDGRIVDIAKTGFVGGVLVVPHFVLSELHQVADSSDALRRKRGRRGLAKLNELKRDASIDFKIIDDDIDSMNNVDDKLVALAIQLEADVVTNDYNLNRVAEAQGINVLNVNLLANAVRSVYIPGEEFAIHVIQEGRESDQGVGYLEDGTMVVVEEGRNHMDRTINVEVTKLINRETGRMIFARPAVNAMSTVNR